MKNTYQELIQCLRDLVLWAGDCDYITRHFRGWEIDFAVPFLLKFFNLEHTSYELSMVQAIDYDGFGDKFGVLYGTALSENCNCFNPTTQGSLPRLLQVHIPLSLPCP